MKQYEADYICSVCGKLLVNHHADYSLHQWGNYFCRKCSPDLMKNGAKNPFKELEPKTLFDLKKEDLQGDYDLNIDIKNTVKAEPKCEECEQQDLETIARITSEKAYIESDPLLENLPPW